jgi:hypothetical protein
MVVAFKQAVVQHASATSWLHNFFPDLPYSTHHAGLPYTEGEGREGEGTREEDAGCTYTTATVGTAPFGLERRITDYELQLVWVQNRAAAKDGDLAAFQQWASALHAASVGLGWGYDRMLDNHIKLTQHDDFSVPTHGSHPIGPHPHTPWDPTVAHPHTPWDPTQCPASLCWRSVPQCPLSAWHCVPSIHAILCPVPTDGVALCPTHPRHSVPSAH